MTSKWPGVVGLAFGLLALSVATVGYRQSQDSIHNLKPKIDRAYQSANYEATIEVTTSFERLPKDLYRKAVTYCVQDAPEVYGQMTTSGGVAYWVDVRGTARSEPTPQPKQSFCATSVRAAFSRWAASKDSVDHYGDRDPEPQPFATFAP